MKTQIMSTPTIYGRDAQEVLEEIKIKPSKKSKENGKKLLKQFKSIVKG